MWRRSDHVQKRNSFYSGIWTQGSTYEHGCRVKFLFVNVKTSRRVPWRESAKSRGMGVARHVTVWWFIRVQFKLHEFAVLTALLQALAVIPFQFAYSAWKYAFSYLFCDLLLSDRKIMPCSCLLKKYIHSFVSCIMFVCHFFPLQFSSWKIS